MTRLVERFGIEPTLHRNDRERLLRLTSLIPTWHPARGRIDKATDALEACGQQEQVAGVRADGDGLEQELFTCKPASWWAARQQEDAIPEYRISDGYLRFQPKGTAKFHLRTEDVLVALKPGGKLPRDLFRLLPAWAVFRPTLPETATTKDVPKATAETPTKEPETAPKAEPTAETKVAPMAATKVAPTAEPKTETKNAPAPPAPHAMPTVAEVEVSLDDELPDIALNDSTDEGDVATEQPLPTRTKSPKGPPPEETP